MPFHIGNCSTSSLGITEPWFFYRQHENDIERPEKPKTVTDQCKRIALMALPMLSYTLYHIVSDRNPLWQCLSLGMNGLRGISSVSMLKKGLTTGNTSQIASGALQTSLSTASIAATIIAPPIGMLISTGQDLTLNAGSLYRAYEKGDYKKAGEVAGHLQSRLKI